MFAYKFCETHGKAFYSMMWFDMILFYGCPVHQFFRLFKNGCAFKQLNFEFYCD